jgi:DNA-binding winged helix-turn-helix (wHTH) protein/TolB-like protein
MDTGRFRFGLFEFDIATRELRRDGVLIRLQAQPAQVLACLVAANRQVVSREDLCKAVWGTETYVDFERGLNFCIAQIRSALDDDSTTPRYVRTIPRRGYQSIAPLERIAPIESAPQPSAPPPTPPSAGKVLTTPVIDCALVFLIVAVSSTAYFLRHRLSSHNAPILAVVRFDNETSDAGMTRFSDALTDSVVVQLTAQSQNRYEVIGNAAILRVPRDQRDLIAISKSLNARYVVLGQVQTSGSQTRVLAHLIHLPDQRHLTATRVDRSVGDFLAAESDISQEIVSKFSQRIAIDQGGNPSSSAPSK